jgi:hypothetical protein
VLDDGRLADILSMGTPDFAAVELVRASLEAGSSDNVTCLVADVVTEEAAAADPSFEALEPLLVGAAAELRRRAPRAKGSLFRGHRSGDTGELDPIEDEIVGAPSSPSAPIDPEAARYAPIPPSRFQWLTRLLALVVVAGLVWAAAAAAYSWTQRQYFVGESDGNVVIYRGINTDLPGMDLSELYQTSDVQLDRLSDYDAGRVRQGIEVGDLDAARETVQNLSAEMSPAEAPAEDPGEDPGDTATETPTETPAGTGSTEGAG